MKETRQPSGNPYKGFFFVPPKFKILKKIKRWKKYRHFKWEKTGKGWKWKERWGRVRGWEEGRKEGRKGLTFSPFASKGFRFRFFDFPISPSPWQNTNKNNDFANWRPLSGNDRQWSERSGERSMQLDQFPHTWFTLKIASGSVFWNFTALSASETNGNVLIHCFIY